MANGVKWLSRYVAYPGPRLCLCLDEKSFAAAIQELGMDGESFLGNGSTARTTIARDRSEVVCVVQLDDTDLKLLELIGLLVHEAVHVWQEYQQFIGEEHPGAEQEAYAIQAISQELLTEYQRVRKTLPGLHRKAQ